MFETYIGSSAYMNIDALNRFMGEGPTITTVHLRTDALHRAELFREMKEIPMISSVNLIEAAVRILTEVATFEEAQVAVIPGIGFGDDKYIRLSFATSIEQIKKGNVEKVKILEKGKNESINEKAPIGAFFIPI